MARFIAVVAFALAAALPGVPRQIATVDPALSGEAIVSVTPGTAERVAEFARRAGAQDVRTLGALNVVTARVDARATSALAANVSVKSIDADSEIASTGRTSEQDLPAGDGGQNNAGESFRSQAGDNGASVTVAVVDSGVADNDDLAGKVLTRVDFVNDGVTSYDPGGHGTFIAGLIAGSVTGVDPNAKIVSLRVLNEHGVGRARNALAAFDWLLRHRDEYHVRVVNLSWGATQRTSYHMDVLAAAAESLWFAGMTVVVAAGNDGPAAGTIDTPGSDPFVITVGSVNQSNTTRRGDDRESIWSSRGPTLDGFTKPDLLAPGENVVSLRVPGSYLDRWYSDHRAQTGPNYTTMSGTSVSAALVSGAAALLIGNHEDSTPTVVKSALVSTGAKVRGSVTPQVNPARALRFKEGHITPANRGLLPSRLLLLVLSQSVGGLNITWENITWESITWETITWENLTWETLTWETLTWETLTWETRRE